MKENTLRERKSSNKIIYQTLSISLSEVLDCHLPSPVVGCRQRKPKSIRALVRCSFYCLLQCVYMCECEVTREIDGHNGRLSSPKQKFYRGSASRKFVANENNGFKYENMPYSIGIHQFSLSIHSIPYSFLYFLFH